MRGMAITSTSVCLPDEWYIKPLHAARMALREPRDIGMLLYPIQVSASQSNLYSYTNDFDLYGFVLETFFLFFLLV